MYADTKQFTKSIRKAEKEANDSTAGISKSLRGMDRDVQKSSKEAQGLATSYSDVKDEATGLSDGMFALGRAAKNSRSEVDQHEKSQGRLSRTLSGVSGALRRNKTDHDDLGKGIGKTTKQIFKLNQAVTLMRTVFGLIKFPAIIAGIGYLAAAFSAATAGVVAFVAAMGPAVNVIGAIPQAASVAIQSLITLKLGFAGVGDAMKDSMKEFKKPGPAATKFAGQLQGLLPHVKDFREGIQEAFLPRVWNGLKAATKNFDIFSKVFRGSGAALGGVVEKLGAFVGSKGFGKDFAALGASNNKIIGIFGNALVYVAHALTNVAVAARPLTEWLFKLTEQWSKSWYLATETSRANGELAKSFGRTRDVLTTLGHILSQTWVSLKNIGKIGAATIGDSMLKDLDKLTMKWQTWTGSVEGKSSLKKYFSDAKAPLYEFLGLFGDIVKMIFQVGAANAGPLTDLFKKIRTDLIPVLTEMFIVTGKTFGPALVEMLVQVARAMTLLAGANGPLTLLVKAIGGLAKGFANLVEKNPELRSFFFLVVGLWGAFKVAKILGAITGITKLGGAIFGLTKIGGKIAKAGGLAKYIGLAGFGWIAGIVAAGVALYVLYKKVGWFHDAVNAVGTFLKGAFFATIEGLKTAFFAVKGALIAFGTAAATVGTAIYSGLSAAFNWVKGAIHAVIDEVSQWKLLIGIVKLYFGAIKTVIMVEFTIIKTVFTTAWTYISTYFKAVWSALSAVVSVAMKTISAYIKVEIAVIKAIFSVVWPALKAVVKTAWDGIKQVITGAVSVIKGIINVFLGIMRGDFSRVWEGIKQIFSGALNAIVGIIRVGTAPILTVAAKIWSGVKAGASAAWGAIKGVVSGALNGIKSIITGLFGVFKSLGSTLVENIGKGISSAFGGVKRAFISVVNGIIGVAETFLNAIIDVINLLPFVDIGGGGVRIPRIGGGGSNSSTDGGNGGGHNPKTTQGDLPPQNMQRRARGGAVTSPVVMMGEEAPRHHEWVIATNPAYKRNNIRYWAQAGHDLGVPGFKKGGNLSSVTGAGSANSGVGTTAHTGTKGGNFVSDAAGWVGGKVNSLVKGFMGMLPGNPFSAPMDQFGSGILNKAKDFIFGNEGLKKIGDMKDFAVKAASNNWPYVYGGGHSSFAGPYDCSGYVSAILNSGGLLGSPLDTVGLRGALEPGAGKYVTVGVRGGAGKSGHTMMSIGGANMGSTQYFESGSGHGAKSVGGWSGNFDKYHPTGYKKGGYFGKYGSGVTVKGNKASAEQRSVLGNALRLADKWKVPYKAKLALVEALIVESEAKNLGTASADGYGSYGVLQGRVKYHKKSDLMDPAYQIGAFLGKGRGGKATNYKGFTGRGNAVGLSKGKMTSGQIAQAIEGSAYPDRYQKVSAEARKIIKLGSKAKKLTTSSKKTKPKAKPKTAAKEVAAIANYGKNGTYGKETPYAMDVTRSDSPTAWLSAIYSLAQASVDTADDMNWWTMYIGHLKTVASSVAGMRDRGDPNWTGAYNSLWDMVSGMGDKAAGLAGINPDLVKPAVKEIADYSASRGLQAPPSVTALTAAEPVGEEVLPDYIEANLANAELDNVDEPSPPSDDAPQSEWDQYYTDWNIWRASLNDDMGAAGEAMMFWWGVRARSAPGSREYAAATRNYTAGRSVVRGLKKAMQSKMARKPVTVTNPDGSTTTTNSDGTISTTAAPPAAPLPTVVSFGDKLPENIASGVVSSATNGTVNVSQYFTQPPADPYAFLRSSEWAARAVFG